MSRPEAAQPNQPCGREDTLFTIFKQQQSNPDLDYIRGHHYNNFLRLPKVTLNEAEDAAQKAISGIMRGPCGRPFGQAIKRHVLASFQYLAHSRSLVPKETERLRQLVDDWHAFLDQAVGPDRGTESTSTKYILTAFSLIEDYTIALTQEVLNELVEAIADREGKTPEDALREARRRADAGKNGRGGKLNEAVWDSIDILALIIVLMNQEGLKPFVLSADLQAWVIEYFSPSSSKTLGGAAGNEAYMLHEMGLPVLVHSPYHHTNQADAAPDYARRLVFDDAGPVRPFPSLGDGEPDSARRFSFVLQLTPTQGEDGNVGPVLIVDGQEIRPKLTDRVILRIPKPRTDQQINWKQLRVVWKARGDELDPVKPEDPSRLEWDDKAGHWVLEIDRDARINKKKREGEDEWEEVFNGFLDNDWPYLPIFQHRATVDADGALTVELASADELEEIADHVQAVLLGGIQMFGQTVFTEALTDLLRITLIEQLKALGSEAASLYFELSGVDSGEVLARLGEVCREAGIRNVSTNREELVQITSEFGSPHFVSPRPITPESPFTIYWRAKHLLKKLKVCTYYIHDLELDILARRNQPDENSVEAAVALERHRQAMLLAKAAVPEALICRAKAPQKWDLILSTQSLVALLAFANDYADYVAATVKGVEREAILEQILRKGYYQHPDPDGVSVVVAPAIFVDFGQGVSMAGAGDMCFAVHASR